ncbi:hypothetical protein A2454_00840 [Candidatus Peribacteria bacterium RIFOXYC2_FULL_55_14]|nr:MAG: hypothetical protein A2198_05500 [Candidatus Peribacteria bacterium RIFOXYA1_FULL_56_14]OGJ73022.1 MAG: hypothetical protein A2217_07015 [Candidatus Peribacteria bacterium RIFOXYA2_FULL_55_28]OGJ74010.1 MAG: hypothetical protein A2384_05280 [Candidatus Peribacteria bacterium RIFOXYB1_FULL_54_35]OGJ76188.1 MAG: hypothetical protein A2327_04755 [Candidatus Peribacteria bacterium RIFOXYB2_FULL_54_17]OGJ79647.1 MAG: hypothetical protein A2424_01240 [Candidatus Peribacteria bacterium RIFOXYC
MPMNARRRPQTTRGVLEVWTEVIRGRVLDLGAGRAKYKQLLQKTATDYTAFDMVDGPNIDVVGDVHNLPFDPCKFGTVVCTQVIEHVREPWRVVEEIARVLLPGGHCLLTTPFMMPHHADPHDFYRYTPDGVRHLCGRAGLEIVASGKYGGANVVAAETLKFLFCNPYAPHKPGIVRRNIFRMLYGLLLRIQRGAADRSVVYANVYVVARKPV